MANGANKTESSPVTGLAELEPGRLPLGVFNQIARLTVTPVVEVVPIYNDNGAPRVMLYRRPDDDQHWPNQYYVPGTILNAQDQPGDLRDAFSRVLGKLGALETTEPVFADNILCKVARGTELALVHWTELLTRPEDDMLFDPSGLPADMIEGHNDFVIMALTSYRARV